MSFAESRPEVPTWIAGLVVALFAASLAYGIGVRQSLSEPIMAWLSVLGVGLSLFVVYLLYRLVLAVEQIARNK